MANEKKVNAIADAEQAGLYYSSNTEPGYTRKMNEKEQLFFDISGKPLKSKRFLSFVKNATIVISTNNEINGVRWHRS